MEKFWSYRIRQFPLPAKVMVVGYLLALGLAYVYALANIALVVGLSPRDIAVHYYGAAEKVQPKAAAPQGEQGVDLDAMSGGSGSNDSAGFEHPQPSLKNLVTEGHFHLFGMTSFFFGLTLLGLFTSFRDNVKAFFVGFPYIAVIVDNLSFMATRFIGPKLAFLTAAAGGLMGLTFTILWFAILLEVLQPNGEKA